MRGGNFEGHGKCCAPRYAIAALVGLTWSLGSVTIAQFSEAADRTIEDQCDRLSRNEKSILIASGKSSSHELARTLGDETVGRVSLEPIANVSEHEPDLADPAIAAVPDLAEPVDSDSEPHLTAVEGTNTNPEPSPEYRALSFHGVTPGVSYRRDVFRAWGDPRNDETTGKILTFHFDKLRSVRAKFAGNKVDAIVVELDEPLSVDSLAAKLELDAVRPATLRDEEGTPLAVAYPERGVVLRLVEEEQVGEVVVQPIKAASFLLRAENNLRTHLTHRTEDLLHALNLDRKSAHAYWLLSDTCLALGKATAAEQSAAEAVDLEPQNHKYRLQHAKCLRHLARYEQALEQAQEVLDSQKADELSRARALYETGLLAALSSQEVSQRAIPLFTKAIELSDQLSNDAEVQVRGEAMGLLVDLHLAMAIEISKGKWGRKDQTVPQWIERASALSEEMISTDSSNLPLRLQVAVSALAAIANLDEPVDPTLWIEEAEETVYLLHSTSEDPKTRDTYDWQLGLAYFHGAQIQHQRSDPEGATELGELAAARLSELAGDRDELPSTASLMGRLYFQLGAVQAVHYEDHKAACEWYEKAVAHLLIPEAAGIAGQTPQLHGDALVSMGVSFWYTKQRKEAIEVTVAGAQLIEQGVRRGILQSEALEVPYQNLANMYQAQGKDEPAARYSRLAKKVSGSKVTSKPTPEKRS